MPRLSLFLILGLAASALAVTPPRDHLRTLDTTPPRPPKVGGFSPVSVSDIPHLSSDFSTPDASPPRPELSRDYSSLSPPQRTDYAQQRDLELWKMLVRKARDPNDELSAKELGLLSFLDKRIKQRVAERKEMEVEAAEHRRHRDVLFGRDSPDRVRERGNKPVRRTSNGDASKRSPKRSMLSSLLGRYMENRGHRRDVLSMDGQEKSDSFVV